jgi:hypothetical protein
MPSRRGWQGAVPSGRWIAGGGNAVALEPGPTSDQDDKE